MRRRRTGPAAVLLLLALVSGCTGDSETPSAATASAAAALRMASYDFHENQTLVEVYAEAARRAGVPVTVEHGMGTREILSPALEQGLVDVLVDYTGTALAFARADPAPARRPPEEVHAALERTLSTRGVAVLDAAEAQDQNGFAVTRAFAGEHDVSRLSDLAPLAGELAFGGPPECPERPFCLLGLRDTYGLEFADVQAMTSRGETAEALRIGQIDVGMLETTDPRLAVSSLILLTDDQSLQPPENVVPLVRSDALDRWGDHLRTALDEVSARLTTEDLIQLNRLVAVEGMSSAEAANRWWNGL